MGLTEFAVLIAFACVVLLGLAVACSKTPSAFCGQWKCEKTTVVARNFAANEPHVHNIILELKKNGAGKLEWKVDKQVADKTDGNWEKVGSYIVLQLGEANGFAVFKVVSLEKTRMTLLSRAGDVWEFTRMP